MKQIIAIIIAFGWFMVKVMQHGLVPFFFSLLTIAVIITAVILLCKFLFKRKTE